MTQNSDPYENAVAERINGILKQEFFIDNFNQTLPITTSLVKNAIEIYNENKTRRIAKKKKEKSENSQSQLVVIYNTLNLNDYEKL